MTETLLKTKFFIPQNRPELVSRPRLIEQLKGGLYQKLTLISGPAGFGKTTLVSDWLHQSEQPAAWLSLDENDNDPVRFIKYLIASLSQLELLGQNFGETASKILESPQAPPIENMLVLLINEIAGSKEHIVLVLDDYHMIDANPIHEAIGFFIENAPPQLHSVISTRVDPPLPLVRLRARNQLNELRAAELRFTLSEVAEFVKLILGVDLSPQEIESLETRTEGWIAGLQMAAISMKGSQDVAGFIQSFTGSNRYILDYLLEEVLEQQPERVQLFMMQTAVLDRLSGPLCRAVTGYDDSQALLETMEQENLFIIPLDEERVWYRYHHLFAELLQQRFNRKHPDQTASLHIKASEWYEANNLIYEAISHALRCEDPTFAVSMIGKHIENIWGAGRHATIQRWVARIPEETVNSMPQLSIIQAWYQFVNGQQRKAEQTLEFSEKAITEISTDANQPEMNKLQGRVAAIRGFIANYNGDLPGMVKHANTALALLPPEDLTWRCIAVWVLGDAYLFDNDILEAYKSRLQALEISEATGHHYLELVSQLRLAETLRFMGKLDQTLELCKQTMEFVIEKGITKTVASGWLRAVWGNVLAEKGEVEMGRRKILEGVEVVGSGGRDMSFFAWTYLYYLKILFSCCELNVAGEEIEKLQIIFGEYDMPVLASHQLDAFQAQYWLRQGNLNAVSEWVGERGLKVNGKLSFLNESEVLVFARWLMTSEQVEDAISLFERLLKNAKSGGRNLTVIEILNLLALAHQANGDKSRALEALEQSVSLAMHCGAVQCFVDEGPPMHNLLGQLKPENRLVKAYCQELTNKFEHTDTNAGQAGNQPLVDPLSDREIEVLALLAAGLSNKEVGNRLYLTLNTVKAHTRNIYSKLDVNNRTLAVNRARELNILTE